MLRRLLACLVVGLCTASAALAAGPDPGVTLGGLGVGAPGGKIRYVALAAHPGTTVAVIRTRESRVLRSTTYKGSFGIPAVAFDGSTGGVSSDGSTLVLADTRTGNGDYPLKKRSSFLVVDTKSLRVRATVALKGHYSFDALSPDGSQLYLIQHVSAENLTRYVVRAYDLQRGRLTRGLIADKSQRGWVMNGMPLARVTSTGGRWVYTFYGNSGGYPFVHALDTVRGVAHCIGIPWRRANQNALAGIWLSVHDGGRTLTLRWPSGREYLAITRGTWRISHPTTARTSASFPWWIVGFAGGAALLAAAALLVARRRGHRPGPLGWQRA